MNTEHNSYRNLALDLGWEKLDRLYQEAETSRLLASAGKRTPWSWRDLWRHVLQTLRLARPITPPTVAPMLPAIRPDGTDT